MTVLVANESTIDSVKVGRVTIAPRQEAELELKRATTLRGKAGTNVTLVNLLPLAIELGEHTVPPGARHELEMTEDGVTLRRAR